MRETYFRGKTPNNGWRWGDILQINHKIYIYPVPWGDLEDIDFGHMFEEVIPETVGQYTNQRQYDLEFYEGDKIRFNVFNYTGNDETHEGFIEWDKDRWVVKADNFKYSLAFVVYNDNAIEIVGNIHEN